MYKWVRWKVDQRLRDSNAPDADGTALRKRLPQRVNAFGYTVYTRQMIELAREAGARVILLSLLHGNPLNTGYWQALIELSKEYDLPLIVYDGPKLDVVHPTAEGYQWLAAEIVDRLVQTGGLPPVTAAAH
jgi:lysophospholipase L1-like esterase